VAELERELGVARTIGIEKDTEIRLLRRERDELSTLRLELLHEVSKLTPLSNRDKPADDIQSIESTQSTPR
jgi:hypothetical protein